MYVSVSSNCWSSFSVEQRPAHNYFISTDAIESVATFKSSANKIWIQHVRSFFATICPTKDFRAFLGNQLSSLFSYQGSYNKPEQREGQHDFSTSDVHSGGSQHWQLQWIHRKHSLRHREKSTEFVWELLSLLAPRFMRSLLSLTWTTPLYVTGGFQMLRCTPK